MAGRRSPARLSTPSTTPWSPPPTSTPCETSTGRLRLQPGAALYRAYESELYRFDQLYRHFCEAADQAEAQGWDILKPLREAIEAVYTNWYLPRLSLAWGKFVGPLLTKWQIERVPNQHDFFEKHVRPWLEEADRRRVFVIISDAFRYEAAQELARNSTASTASRPH